MGHKILRFLLKFIFIYTLCNLSLVKALIGRDVRAARRNEFPATVAISKVVEGESNPEDNVQCAGVLISNRDVITAAHCLQDEQLTAVKFLIGSNDLRIAREYFAAWWITYAEWAEEQRVNPPFNHNDLCIARLSVIVHASVAQPARILRDMRALLFLRRYESAGWGSTNDVPNPRYLHVVDLHPMSLNQCRRRYREATGQNIDIGENHLCTESIPYAFLYPGDSGGPLYSQSHDVVAIARGTMPRLPPFQPLAVNLHIDLYYYNDFITSVLDEFN